MSKSEIEQPRSGQELLPWVERRMDEIGQTKEGTAALRYPNGAVKQLAEEVYPLAIWASGLDRAERVTIEPKAGSQNFDAVVTMHDAKGALYSWVEHSWVKREMVSECQENSVVITRCLIAIGDDGRSMRGLGITARHQSP